MYNYGYVVVSLQGANIGVESVHVSGIYNALTDAINSGKAVMLVDFSVDTTLHTTTPCTLVPYVGGMSVVACFGCFSVDRADVIDNYRPVSYSGT